MMAGNRGGTNDSPSAWEQTRPWIILVIFAAVALTTTLRHEMWRDEIHAWQAVVSADSPWELVENVRAEAHPGLWFAMLYPVSRATTDPVAMQLVHWLVAVGVAAMVIFFSPFPWSWRVLAIFGYFPLYEYGAISRNYAIGALLLFAFCAVYPYRSKKPLVAAALLFLLAQTNVYALILCFALGLMWFVEDRREAGGAPIFGSVPQAGAIALWLFGMALSVVQLIGARTVMHSFDPEKTFEAGRTLMVLATPWRGYVPVPVFRYRFWNSNILDGFADGALFQSVLGLVLISIIATLFIRRPPLLVLYLVGSAGLLAFTYVFYVGHLRHHGHHFLLLLVCLWLWSAGTGGDSKKVEALPRRGLLVLVLLVVNAAAGTYAVARDWRDPFSAAQEVARSIRAEGLMDLPIVGHRDVAVTTVAGYLGRPVYYPSLGRETDFIAWNTTDWLIIDDAEVLSQADSLAKERDSDVLIVFSRSGRRRPDPLGAAIRIGDFPDSIVGSERYELYRLSADAAAIDSGP